MTLKPRTPHLWDTPDAHQCPNRERRALPKLTTFVVNRVWRALIDEAALVEWLRDKRIAGAGLAVFETAPLPQGHPLTALPNVLLTSHGPGMTPDSNLIRLDMVAENVANFLNGVPAQMVAGGTR